MSKRAVLIEVSMGMYRTTWRTVGTIEQVEPNPWRNIDADFKSRLSYVAQWLHTLDGHLTAYSDEGLHRKLTQLFKAERQENDRDA